MAPARPAASRSPHPHPRRRRPRSTTDTAAILCSGTTPRTLKRVGDRVLARSEARAHPRPQDWCCPDVQTRLAPLLRRIHAPGWARRVPATPRFGGRAGRQRPSARRQEPRRAHRHVLQRPASPRTTRIISGRVGSATLLHFQCCPLPTHCRRATRRAAPTTGPSRASPRLSRQES